jgi:hypothetical protein
MNKYIEHKRHFTHLCAFLPTYLSFLETNAVGKQFITFELSFLSFRSFFLTYKIVCSLAEVHFFYRSFVNMLLKNNINITFMYVVYNSLFLTDKQLKVSRYTARNYNITVTMLLTIEATSPSFFLMNCHSFFHTQNDEDCSYYLRSVNIVARGALENKLKSSFYNNTLTKHFFLLHGLDFIKKEMLLHLLCFSSITYSLEDYNLEYIFFVSNNKVYLLGD